MADHQAAQESIAKNREEMEDLFSAIQEIALNLEQKKAECTQLVSENDQLTVTFLILEKSLILDGN